MSGKNTEKAVETANSVQEEKTAKNAEPKFAVKMLRAHCMKLFKISTSTFDGALHGHDGSEMTVSECRRKINKWLGKKE